MQDILWSSFGVVYAQLTQIVFLPSFVFHPVSFVFANKWHLHSSPVQCLALSTLSFGSFHTFSLN